MRCTRYPALLRLSALALIAACSSSDLTGPDVRTSAATMATGRNPVLFVHGWNSTGAAWFTTIDRLIADGYQPSELYNWTYYSAQSNVITAQQIAAKVDSILSITGATQVDIVTHSMGSLSARYYIRNLGGSAKVDALVSLAGANHGTNTAYFCGQTSCIEMRPKSSFLNALNRKDETPGTPRYGTWWSPCDEVINPRTSVLLSGATNNETACLLHSDLHEDPTVYAGFKSWL